MSGGKQKTSSTGWKPALDQIKSDVLPGIADYSKQYGGGEGIYQGSVLADQNPLIGQGQENLLATAGKMGGQLDNVMGTLEGFLNYDPNSYQNQAQRDALGSNISALFNQSIRPGIEDRGTGVGQFGGNQQSLALGAATQPLSRAIADSEVSMMNADKNRAFEAMGAAPGLISSQLMPGQIQSDIGSQRTQRSQQELADQIQQMEAPRRAQLQSLLEQSGLLTQLSGMGSSTSTPGASPLQGALGGAGVGSSFGPWGAAIGGGLGALGSL